MPVGIEHHRHLAREILRLVEQCPDPQSRYGLIPQFSDRVALAGQRLLPDDLDGAFLPLLRHTSKYDIPQDVLTSLLGLREPLARVARGDELRRSMQ